MPACCRALDWLNRSAHRAPPLVFGRRRYSQALAPSLRRSFAHSRHRSSRGSHPVDNRRQITILSCDMVHSTELLKSLGDERYSEVLSQYHRTVAEIVHGHLGSIEDPQGDGILAFFGFPEAQEDCSTQAVKTALSICLAVRSLDVQVRIGISTGSGRGAKGETGRRRHTFCHEVANGGHSGADRRQ